MVVKIGFVKVGNIGSAPLIELLLDERAEREDIDVRVVSAGAKLGVEQAEDVARKILDFNPKFVVVTTPNASLPGPTKIREVLKEAGVPAVTVSDSPAKSAIKKIEGMGQGYIIVEADSMLGARREFLDPVEMALFNADIIKVLAVTGAFRLICSEMDKVIEAFKREEAPTLPHLVIKREKAVAAAGFCNPYAQAKAIAAYEMAGRAADLSVEGCFVVKERARYIPLITAAHEMVREAARLADEAREIEKANDTVSRTPHYDDGTLLCKFRLEEKPVEPARGVGEVVKRIPEDRRREVSEKLLDTLLKPPKAVNLPEETAKSLLALTREEQITSCEGLRRLLEASLSVDRAEGVRVLEELGLQEAASILEVS